MRDTEEPGSEARSRVGVTSTGSFQAVTAPLTRAEAIEIAESVVARHLQDLRSSALETARLRITEIASAMVSRIAEPGIDALSALSDPDVQATLAEAEWSYARSGRPEVRQALIDLVAQRCRSRADSLESSIITDAIVVVRKLSRESIAGLTLVFLFRRFRPWFPTLEKLEQWAVENLEPFLADCPHGSAEWEYLVSTGCLVHRSSTRDPFTHLTKGYPGLFQKGIRRGDVDPRLLSREKSAGHLFVKQPSSDYVRLRASAITASEAIERLGLPKDHELAESYLKHLYNGMLPESKIRDVLSDSCPTWVRVVDYLTLGGKGAYAITSMGMAIAHSNWTNRIGRTDPFVNWLID